MRPPPPLYKMKLIGVIFFELWTDGHTDGHIVIARNPVTKSNNRTVITKAGNR